MPVAHRIYLTLVHTRNDGDAFFPEIPAVFAEISRERAEDTFVANAVKRHGIVRVRAPQLYVYTVTGENTWDEQHLGVFRVAWHDLPLPVLLDRGQMEQVVVNMAVKTEPS